MSFKLNSIERNTKFYINPRAKQFTLKDFILHHHKYYFLNEMTKLRTACFEENFKFW